MQRYQYTLTAASTLAISSGSVRMSFPNMVSMSKDSPATGPLVVLGTPAGCTAHSCRSSTVYVRLLLTGYDNQIPTAA
jgi:hypothetical protein